MKVADCHRSVFYKLCRHAFDALGMKPNVVELGVFKGDNAHEIISSLDPFRAHLLDTWSAEDFIKAYSPFSPLPKWLSPVESQFDYYQGDALSKDHWDRIYSQVIARFGEDQRVSVYRASPEDLYKHAVAEASLRKFDYVYIDASHQFEYVFRDLMLYSELVSFDGIIQMNDCCHSDLGIKQNLGVLEAVVKFVKLSNWSPVVLNTLDFSDLVLARKGSKILNIMNSVLFSSNLKYVEVPSQLLGSAKILRNRSGKNILCFD